MYHFAGAESKFVSSKEHSKNIYLPLESIEFMLGPTTDFEVMFISFQASMLVGWYIQLDEGVRKFCQQLFGEEVRDMRIVAVTHV